MLQLREIWIEQRTESDAEMLGVFFGDVRIFGLRDELDDATLIDPNKQRDIALLVRNLDSARRRQGEHLAVALVTKLKSHGG